METFTINGLLRNYFNTDSIELGENKPKLSKQLKKLKIEVSDLEIKFWGEAVQFKDLDELNLGEEGLIYIESDGWVDEDEVIYSDEYEEYIDRDRAVYAENIDSWVREDDNELDECSYCGNPVHCSRNYIETESHHHFCDRDCMENFYDIVEC